MNPAHFHLLLNHLPIVATIIGTLVLISGIVLKNNVTVKQTALGILIFSALTAIPAYISGEGAEEIAENLPGVTEQFIENHEDLGKLFLIANIITGIMASITLFLCIKKSNVSSMLFYVVLVMALVNCFFAKQVGTSGGEIRHTEIRSTNNIGSNTNAVDTNTHYEEERDND
jgi:uncharacterized membrane protein